MWVVQYSLTEYTLRIIGWPSARHYGGGGISGPVHPSQFEK